MALYKVDISGIDTAALPTLTPQQLQELLQQCAAGDEAARERLICGNLRLLFCHLKTRNILVSRPSRHYHHNI